MLQNKGQRKCRAMPKWLRIRWIELNVWPELGLDELWTICIVFVTKCPEKVITD